MLGGDGRAARSGLAPEWYGVYGSGVASEGEPALRLFGEIGGLGRYQLPFDRGEVLFEGYLYGARELASQLGVAPAAGPAELAALVYLAEGADVFRRLRGAFLLAIADRASTRLLLGHDAMGRHPVYVALEAGSLLFGSNLFALAYSGRVSREPDLLSLALRLYGVWPQSGATFHQAIRRVRPGHYLSKVAGSAPEEREFWELFPAAGEELDLAPAEAEERFEKALEQAVARTMEREPNGIMFSGGLDSVGIAAVALDIGRRLGRAPLVACSARNPPGAAPSTEDAYQDSVAERLGMPLRTSHQMDWLGDQDPFAASFAQIARHPGPTDIWWCGSYIAFYRHVAAQGLDRLLTGSGGDEWLGVHGAAAADMLKRLDLAGLAAFVRAEALTGSWGWRVAFQRVLWREGLRRHLMALGARWMGQDFTRLRRRRISDSLPDWLCPDPEIRQLLIETLEARAVPPLNEHGCAPGNHYRHTLAHLWAEPLMSYEFERKFHISRSLGIEFQEPYHDPDLSRLCNRLAPRALLGKGCSKGLLRQVIVRRLPDLGLEAQRKTSGHLGESLTELREGLPPHQAHIRPTTLDGMGLVWEQRITKGEYPDLGAAARAFTALSAELWCRLHLG
jgi:asparagine synthetase B (glutamine-hydrolysing)